MTHSDSDVFYLIKDISNKAVNGSKSFNHLYKGHVELNNNSISSDEYEYDSTLTDDYGSISSDENSISEEDYYSEDNAVYNNQKVRKKEETAYFYRLINISFNKFKKLSLG